ncbi:hypothetical protein HBI04_154680 [Parastagonospora nodorum]|nr:hypothetical protein HBH45_159560 [Parastagonospora nodorum]KAH4154973.1 hypothetical protein HBH44_140700 [Parastagonospora nodorum]KAH4256855.1 hypothetical protein HBI03_159680 [Parastagonospora nodorum]KAH4270043.1 hypothetical protein HBI04_154680 [Parastagonospora nodorum]KAH4631509.1 hypothetical protein HBH81_149780 [Parastagonospora nodorum]
MRLHGPSRVAKSFDTDGSKDAARGQAHHQRKSMPFCQMPDTISRYRSLPVRRSMPGSNDIAYNGLLSFAALLL